MDDEDPGHGADRGRLAAAFWGAVALSVALKLVWWGGYLLYPFAVLSTWAHEMGHGLTALLAGGTFEHLVIRSDLGGYARCAPGSALAWPLVSAGGLLGPAVAGGLIVVLGARERLARHVLAALAAATLLSVVVWIRSPFGAVAVGAIGLLLLALARFGTEGLRLVVSQLVGIQLCMASLSSADYMFTRTFERDGEVVASDTQMIAERLLLPFWFWGGLVLLASLAILGAAFYLAWVRPLLEARAGAGGGERAA